MLLLGTILALSGDDTRFAEGLLAHVYPMHMPRAVASFKNAGLNIEHWPVDDAVSEASMVSSALHEWMGLIVYRLLGRTGRLLPT